MGEEYVNMELMLDKDLSSKLSKMTKKGLIERMIIVALEAKVAESKLVETEMRTRREIESLETKLDKAEAYVEQGRAMVTAVMERWYEYDA